MAEISRHQAICAANIMALKVVQYCRIHSVELLQAVEDGNLDEVEEDFKGKKKSRKRKRRDEYEDTPTKADKNVS